MKKIATLLLASLFTFGTPLAQAKNLIVYFTNPESIPNDKLDGVSGASKIIKDGEAYGGNEYLAREIQKNVGGDLFRIETVQAYPTEHQPVLDFAQAEQRQGIKPALKSKPNLADYDTIYVGYPIWWYQMPKKHYFQLLQDLLLTVLLILLLGYHHFGEALHEWLGLVFLVLIFSHTGLNTWWFKKLKQGGWNGYRVLQTLMNFALIGLFLTACVSGILLSKHLFSEMPFHLTDDFTRKTHMLSVHWVQIVIAMHVGLHWKALAGMLAKMFRINLNGVFAKWLLPTVWMAITAYGFYTFQQRELFPYLTNSVDFAFFDSSESQAVFFADYFAILIAFAYSLRVVVWAVWFRK